jgi:tRNA(Ile)-lysidine synthase
MSDALRQRVTQTIRRHRMLQAGDRVGVAVSGGADSVALLLLLEELREPLGITLLVLHFNHQLRGAESDGDERFVAGLAAERGLEFVAGREDVGAAARRPGTNLEEVARQLRYLFLEGVVASARATRVAVAHTADDQAETVLAHIIRGTGPAGLAAIYPVAGNVIRPLLEIRRQELRDFLAARGQGWREDVTNRDVRRLRARIRQSLLPLLESEFQPAVVTHLAELATRAREDEAFWAALVEECFRALVSKEEEGWSIRIPDLLAPMRWGLAPSLEAGSASAAGPLAALSRRLVRRLYAAAKGDRRQLTARHVEQVVLLATASTSGRRVHLPGGVVVERGFDLLLFRRLESPGAQVPRGTAAASPAYEIEVELRREAPATVTVASIGRRFELKVVDWPPPGSDTSILAEALDADLVCPPIVLRSWRPGDAYRPRGFRRVHKLKRLLLERRVALRERAGWPVLTSAGRLVWARGLPPAEEFAARAGTRAGLLIAEEQI